MKDEKCVDSLDDYLNEVLRTLNSEQVTAIRLVMSFVESQSGWKAMLEKYPNDPLIESYFLKGKEKEVGIMRALKKEPVEVCK